MAGLWAAGWNSRSRPVNLYGSINIVGSLTSTT
jgi:hypothetical protein